MRILSLDTSGRFDAVGLIDGRRVLSDFVAEAEGDSLEDIILNVDFLDPAGRVLGATRQLFSSQSFYGFETFTFSVDIGRADISKVRLYPKPG